MVDEKALKACRYIAGHVLALGGPDLSGLSDEELVTRIKESCVKLSDAVKKMGCSLEEATRSFEKLSDAFKKSKDGGI